MGIPTVLEKRLRWAFLESKEERWKHPIPTVDTQLRLAVRLLALRLPDFWNKPIDSFLEAIDNSPVLKRKFNNTDKLQLAFAMREART